MTLWEFLFGRTAPDLQRGARNEYVARLQNQLNLKGAGLKVDSAFGPKTLEAVKEFQRQRGLVVDGVVGKHTRRELNRWWL